MADSKREI
jgi:hypothetical protein